MPHITLRFIVKVLPDADQLVSSSRAFPPQKPEPNKLVLFRSYLIRNTSVTRNGLDKGHACNFSDGLVRILLHVYAVPTNTLKRERIFTVTNADGRYVHNPVPILQLLGRTKELRFKS